VLIIKGDMPNVILLVYLTEKVLICSVMPSDIGIHVCNESDYYVTDNTYGEKGSAITLTKGKFTGTSCPTRCDKSRSVPVSKMSVSLELFIRLK
jgi:hypothetical protein